MEEKAVTGRKSRKEAIEAKIEKLDVKIKELNDKIKKLEEEKAAEKERLKKINAAEAKAKEEQEMKALRSLIKQKNLSIDDLRIMLENQKDE